MPVDLDIPSPLESVRRRVGAARDRLAGLEPRLVVEEHGEIMSLSEGVARVAGLPGVQSEELVVLGRGVNALALDLREDHVSVALLDDRGDLGPGDLARRTGRVLDVPVGRELLGRVVDGLGRPLDDRPAPRTSERWPVEREAPPIMDRAPVTEPLETGLKVIDALIPIGRGQRQLIVGDRQIGKTAIAVDTIINQRHTGVTCVYCAIGQRSASVAGMIADLRERGGMEHVVVVTSAEDDPPGLRFVAPYAAMSIAEWFMERGEDALLVLDDLSHHARAYRELSLLMRRPPGREAYPGDIFYIHSRLLERATHLREDRGGGSVTALPIVQTEAQNISAYIPTNLISITDGQILLSPQLFQGGTLPAVDVGRSVSRVGGKTQYPTYREVAGDLRLAYSQFEELESFSRFAARLDEDTRRTLEHGRRIRAILTQDQYDPMSVLEQIALLLAVSEGLMDDVDEDEVPGFAERIRTRVRERNADLEDAVRGDEPLNEEQRGRLLDTARSVLGDRVPEEDRGGDEDDKRHPRDTDTHTEADADASGGDEEEDEDADADEDDKRHPRDTDTDTEADADASPARRDGG